MEKAAANVLADGAWYLRRFRDAPQLDAAMPPWHALSS
jgi:hypothetical protein